MDIEKLKSEITKANESYRAGNPVMDDLSYDALLEQYKEAVSAEEYDAFAKTLHEKAGKVRLPFMMGSLNKLKCQEPETIARFAAKYAPDRLHVSAKVDGISACLVYKGNRLVHAATRGDGTLGESLDDKIRFVKGVVPELPLPTKKDLAIRGELVILKKDFEDMDGTSPRNVCAGIMNRKRTSKEWNEADLGRVTFIPYTVLGGEYTKAEQFQLLKDCGFDVAWHTVLQGYRYEQLKKDPQALADLMFKYATQDLPYEIDGVVVSDTEYRNEDKYYPDAQAAVKTNTMTAETTLIDVSWEGPSKDGIIFPVAIFENVMLGGASVSRATLNNLDYISGLNVKYGCRILVSKRGDIIPAVDSVVSTPPNARDIELPEVCPCCGSELSCDGVNMRCVNQNCRAQKIYRVEHFIKKLGVMNASYKTLDNFGIDSYEKLLSFRPSPGKAIEKKLADELANKVFTRPPEDIFAALNIRNLGERIQKKIIDFYGWKNVSDPNFGFEGGLPPGVGEITLAKFKEARLENLRVAGLFTKDVRYSWTETQAAPRAKTAAKGSVCFTGALSIPRGQAARLAEAAGFEVKNAVTKGLTYLVTPDPNSGSSKNEKAKKYGTKVIDEAAFMELVKTNDDSVMDM
jgi:DNA ligase (NAD+)